MPIYASMAGCSILTTMEKISFPIVLYPNLPIDRQVQLLWSRPKSRMQLIGVLLICALISAIATLLLWQRIGWLGFPVFFILASLIAGWVWVAYTFRPQQYQNLWKYLRPQIPSAQIADDRRGFAEFPDNAPFSNLLQELFPKKIITLRKLDKYTPDFIYLDQAHHLHIDIEIDEPYTPRQYPAETPLTTTHCLRQDDERNQFFQSAQWFVVRFSERQVLLQSKSCLKFLVELVSKLTGETMPNPYANAPDLEPEEQWTEATAKQMAERQERLHYDRYAQR